MKNFIRGAVFLLLAVGSGAVMAVPISGNIAFVGLSTITGTTINFSGATAVGYADGDFAAEGVGVGNVAVFTSFDYAANPFLGISPLWTIGDFSFDLNTITVGPTGLGVDLALFGTGTLMNASYDDTVYNWAYSGNFIGNSTLQIFSSATSPVSVPEPGSLALLGLGLVGFAVTNYRRRRMQA